MRILTAAEADRLVEAMTDKITQRWNRTSARDYDQVTRARCALADDPERASATLLRLALVWHVETLLD